MPPSIHKISIHGSDIIKYLALPIGVMSEEALEAKKLRPKKISTSSHSSEYQEKHNGRIGTYLFLFLQILPLSCLSLLSTMNGKNRVFNKY